VAETVGTVGTAEMVEMVEMVEMEVLEEPVEMEVLAEPVAKVELEAQGVLAVLAVRAVSADLEATVLLVQEAAPAPALGAPLAPREDLVLLSFNQTLPLLLAVPRLLFH
jgi:hypothetical protein